MYGPVLVLMIINLVFVIHITLILLETHRNTSKILHNKADVTDRLVIFLYILHPKGKKYTISDMYDTVYNMKCICMAIVLQY